MARSKMRYDSLNSFLNDVRDLIPDVKWGTKQASKNVLEDYGDGFILVGKKGIFEKEFFILFEDPRLLGWAAMIQTELNEEIKNATT